MRPQALGLFFLVIATVATAQWLEKTIYLPDSAGPQMLCYNPLSRKLYCANEWNCTITVIDGASNAILAHIPVATHPSAICINSLNKVYCAGENSTLLTVIDGTGDSVIKTIDIGATSYIIGSNPTTNKIYCGGNETPTVILDGCADTVLKVLYEESGTYSIWCDPNINKVYIGSAEFWGVRIYDGNADTLLAGIFTQTRFPSAIIGNPNHPKVYSAGTDCDTIWVIDTHADTVMRKITVPNRSSVQDLCYAPDYDRLYCATEREMDAWLMIVDGQTDSLLNLIPVRRFSNFLLYNSINDKIYYTADSLWVIDAATNQVLKKLYAGRGLTNMAWNPIENRVYVGGKFSNTITVFRDSLPSGITEVNSTLDTPFAPTTVRKVLNLNSEMCNLQSKLALLDISGRKVLDLKPGHNDIRHLSPGVYFLMRKNDTASDSKKILIVR